MLPRLVTSPASAPLPQPQPPSAGVVVLTDVDGVLRHADTRSLAEARPAIDALVRASAPVVLCSEHTAAELMWLQRELDLHHPLICEGGAGLYIPRGYFCDLTDLGTAAGEWEVIEFGTPHVETLAALRRVAESTQVALLPFSDLSVDDVATEGGLSLFEAHLARQRLYTEPFRILDPDARAKARLFTAMRGAGLRCVRGTRCYFASGVPDPAHAVRLLVSLYRACVDPPAIVGLAADWRDRALLQEVDAPIVVRNYAVDQTRLLRKVPTAYLTNAAGPAGWTEAILGHCSVGRA